MQVTNNTEDNDSALASQGQLSPMVTKCLRDLGVQHRSVPCDPEYGDVDGLVEKYGFARDQITNTMLVAGKADPTKFAACVVLSTCKVDVNKKVRDLLDVKRATFASAEDTVEQTGMMIGGVTPFGLPANIPVFIDERIWDTDEVLMGGGNRTAKLLVNPDELRKLHSVRVISGLGIVRS